MNPSNCRPIFIFTSGDFTRPSTGSHIRYIEMIEYACQHFPDVIVYGFSNNPNDSWTPYGMERFKQRFPHARLVLEPQRIWVSRLARLKNLALMLFPGYAARILAWKIPGAAPQYETILLKERPWLLINFVDGAIALNGLPIKELVIETHDSKYLRHAKLRNIAVYRMAALARLRSEIAVLSSARAIVAISNVEAGFFKSICSGSEVLYIPTYSRRAPKLDTNISSGKLSDLMFVGSGMSFNRIGLRKFLRENLEWIGNLDITVVGAVCSDPELISISKELPRLHLLGYVENLTSVYANSRAVISPVDGTGLNVKVLEALAHGKPVFVSSHSRDAMPTGHEGCIFDLSRESIMGLLLDPQALLAAGAKARKYYSSGAMTGDLSRLREIFS